MLSHYRSIGMFLLFILFLFGASHLSCTSSSGCVVEQDCPAMHLCLDKVCQKKMEERFSQESLQDAGSREGFEDAGSKESLVLEKREKETKQPDLLVAEEATQEVSAPEAPRDFPEEQAEKGFTEQPDENPTEKPVSEGVGPDTLCSKRTIHVKAGVTGQGDGSKARPFASIQDGFDAASPGDTVLVAAGVYRNKGYGSTKGNNGAVVSMKKGGNARCGAIVIKGESGAKIQFDGSGGLIGQKGVNYVTIRGFEVEGPAGSISRAEALRHRLDNPKLSRYNGHGIAFWGPSHHIRIESNHVHHACGSGIRINKSDYLQVLENRIHDCTTCSASAVSGLVIAEATSIDSSSATKIFIEGNRVYDNKNQVPFYAPNGFPPGAKPPFPWYGTASATKIIDGSGIYLTRNEQSYKAGRIRIVNNVAYRNGINGIVVHGTNRGEIIHNTIANNGTLALSNQRQRVSGIALNTVDDVLLANNLIAINVSGDKAIVHFKGVKNIVSKGNLISGGPSDQKTGVTIKTDLGFLDAKAANFGLSNTSPALDAAQPTRIIVSKDLTGFPRFQPDVGAFERARPVQNVTASLATSDCLVASSPSFVKDRMLVRRFASATKAQESLGNVGKYTYPNATTVQVCFQKQVASAIRNKSSFLQICIQGNGMTCSPKTPSGIQITIP